MPLLRLFRCFTLMLVFTWAAHGQQTPESSDQQRGGTGSRPSMMEHCRAMRSHMDTMMSMMGEARDGENAARTREWLDGTQQRMNEMRRSMDECMDMMDRANDVKSGAAGAMPGMGSGGGMGMMGACCPPGMLSRGAGAAAALVLGGLLGVSAIAALVALTVFLWRRSTALPHAR